MCRQQATEEVTDLSSGSEVLPTLPGSVAPTYTVHAPSELNAKNYTPKVEMPPASSESEYRSLAATGSIPQVCSGGEFRKLCGLCQTLSMKESKAAFFFVFLQLVSISWRHNYVKRTVHLSSISTVKNMYEHYTVTK